MISTWDLSCYPRKETIQLAILCVHIMVNQVEVLNNKPAFAELKCRSKGKD